MTVVQNYNCKMWMVAKLIPITKYVQVSIVTKITFVPQQLLIQKCLEASSS
jgi:hypothetical protein